MRKKTGFKFKKIVLCLALGTMIFAFLACKKERASVIRSDTLGISGEDYHPSWSPDGDYLAFTYGFDDEGKRESDGESWSHICICDLKTNKWTQITTDGKLNEQPDWVPIKGEK